MAALGLKDPNVGLMAGTVLLMSTSRRGDMQQDRSTGWRLGTNRMIQFRYQVAGIVMGAILRSHSPSCSWTAYPILLEDQTVMPADQQPANWASAMTYKFVGVLRSLTEPKPYQRTAIWAGVAIGFATSCAQGHQVASAGYRRFVAPGEVGFADRFRARRRRAALALRRVVRRLRQHATTSMWFGAGGAVSSFFNSRAKRKTQAPGTTVPERHEQHVAFRRRADRGRRTRRARASGSPGCSRP